MAEHRNRDSIGDESIYLRIAQLQKGLLQFTDSTNAYRMVREFGKDIRYIAPWKKWIVWDNCRWEVDDSGAGIFTRQLEMVRNIYAELLKTADYRDRLEIERYAIQSESTHRRRASVKAATWIPDLNATVDDLDRNPWLLTSRILQADRFGADRQRRCQGGWIYTLIMKFQYFLKLRTLKRMNLSLFL